MLAAPVSHAQAIRKTALKRTSFAPNQYIVLLSDVPVASRFVGRDQLATAAATSYRQQIETQQRNLVRDLTVRNFHVTGSVSMLLNAVFVTASASRVEELNNMPGVAGVRPVRRGHRDVNKAIQLANAPVAWNAIGGQSNAGAGMKIAILDSGIDQTHPAFQDSSLRVPAGFPKCNAVSDCQNFTNSKVIVARSYVPQIAKGSDPANPAADSAPDDLSARDRLGHGTAVASIAAGNSNAGSVPMIGMAPKAWLGNYKIYGSPGVNDYPPETVWISAIEDAVKDGMDVAIFSSGLPAISGPLDRGAACGLSGDAPCDALAAAFENAAKSGIVIAASAGNDGESGWITNYPNLGSVSSPAYAPSVLAVGATTSSHVLAPTVGIANGGAPSNLKNIPAVLGDSYSSLVYGSIATAETAPIVDVAQLGNDGLACSALPAFSLDGAYALIQRGTCPFADKATNAQNAGAIGVIIYTADASAPFAAGGVDQFFGNVLMISNSDGLALKSYINSNPGRFITADLAGAEIDIAAYSQSLGLKPAIAANQLASYSSMGPAAGKDAAIKPDLVATGGLDVDLFSRPEWPNQNLPVAPGMYLATQRFDPQGDLYSENGYAAADGTSFAAPLVGGSAALVKQAHPNYSPDEIRSALVNSAAQDVTVDDFGTAVDVEWIGAGRLDAGSAAGATVTAFPTNLSFGPLKSTTTLPKTIQILLVNHATSAVTLAAAVTSAKTVAGISVSLDKPSITLGAAPAGGICPATASCRTTLTASLTGAVPGAGTYTGVVTLQGTGVTMRLPYMFLVGTGTPYNIPMILGNGDWFAGQDMGYWGVGVRDAVGLPVEGAPVSFAVSPRGAITFNTVDGEPACTPTTATSTITCPTDAFGFSWVNLVLGPNPGSPTVTVTAVGTRIPLSIVSRQQPNIVDGGVLAAANVDKGTPIVPGSYVAIYGSGLSDYTYPNPFTTLPLSFGGVTVSFDVPAAGISVPGRIVYISPNQVNVQVPWELQGQSSVKMKVTLNEYEPGNVVTVPVNDFGPAFFHAAADALDEGYKVITPSNAAQRGHLVQLFMNGLGPVNNQPASGSPASATALAKTKTDPVVMIGGVQAPVQFSGLAPGFPGLYQVNVTVPQSVTPGNAVPITVAIGGQTSKAATIPVQ